MGFNLSSGKNKVFYFVIFVALTIILLTFNLTTGCNFRTLQKFQENREMMGTFVSITVYAAEEDFALEAIDSAFGKIKKIEEIASIYSEESEVSFLNKNGYIDNPSAELYELITESKNYTEVTGGAFDITVQPILELWEAGLWKEEENVQKQKISDALNLVGSDMILVDVNRIEFEKEEMSVTLGGIAKGYAVDKAIEVLKAKGIEYALVDAGGDIMASGKKPDGSYWTIALQNPDKESEEIAAFQVHDRAVTTSGNYERYFDPEKEVHHITDPRTGFSANKCISATVISNSCMDADALSTSVFVLGPEEGLSLINKLDGVEALVIDNKRNIFESKSLDEYKY